MGDGREENKGNGYFTYAAQYWHVNPLLGAESAVLGKPQIAAATVNLNYPIGNHI